MLETIGILKSREERGCDVPKLIFCAAGNKAYTDIAAQYGELPGGRLPGKIYQASLYFADQHYSKPDEAGKKASGGIGDPAERKRVYAKAYGEALATMRKGYMKALAKHQPYMATVLDLERPEQFEEVCLWVIEARRYVTKVVIIPKYSGAIAQLKKVFGLDWIAGYSVETSYGKTDVAVEEFAGLEVHLLGGDPMRQYELASCFNTVSVDCNMHMQHARRNMFFSNARTRAKNKTWPMLKESVYGDVKKDTNKLAFTLSCMNINAMWQGCKATVRFAVERDIAQIIAIARQWPQELGYVRVPALRESIARRNLIVASHNSEAQRGYSDILVSPGSEKIIGFCNYRARRDGQQTIYEIAVHRDWQGQKIGAGLLSAVPNPIRLKCVVGNPANDFYEAQSFTHIGIDKGKKRPLNMWQRA